MISRRHQAAMRWGHELEKVANQIAFGRDRELGASSASLDYQCLEYLLYGDLLPELLGLMDRYEGG